MSAKKKPKKNTARPAAVQNARQTHIMGNWLTACLFLLIPLLLYGLILWNRTMAEASVPQLTTLFLLPVVSTLLTGILCLRTAGGSWFIPLWVYGASLALLVIDALTHSDSVTLFSSWILFMVLGWALFIGIPSVFITLFIRYYLNE